MPSPTLATPTAAAARAPAPVERTFASHDGTPLFYRHWPARSASGPAGRGGPALLLFHRGHEHSGRLGDLVAGLDPPDDCAVFAWDARGHGRSPGRRGDAPSFACLARDADCFARHVAAEHRVDLERTIAVGHSMAAVMLAAWVHDYAPPLRAQVLVTPAFRVRLYVPLARPFLRLVRRVRRDAFVRSYVRPRMLTRDREEARAYASDPLITRCISVRLLLDMHDTATRLIDDAAAITTPTLILSAGSDAVVANAPQRTFFDRLGTASKSMEVYAGFRHALLHERDRHLPIERLRRFIEAVQEHAPEPERAAAPVPATGPTSLARPAATPAVADAVRFAPLRLFLRTAGRLGAGIRIGWRHGFDSGPSLDHVYENRARGVSPLGRLIDRVYLDAPGWRGIRQRRDLMVRALVGALESARARARETRREPVHLLDVASGPGRYVLEALAGNDDLRHDVVARLRDRDPVGLEAGRRLAADLGLEQVTYETGDAFDPAGLTAIRPRPDVVVVSGLYELFGDDELIRQSLSGIAGAIRPGGFLIYTNQPWHPQLRLIAATLVNREGRPWVMRCRPQAEMDRLVAGAGFAKLRTSIDDQGIFTVSVAERR